MSSHTLIRCSAGGVKTNQCSLDCIIEEIDVGNKAQVLRGNNHRQSTATAQGFTKIHLSQEPEKHPDFQVTSCHHFDTTNADFAYA